MSWSKCSSITPRGSRFYEECESVSENFLYRGRPNNRNERRPYIQYTKTHTASLFSWLRNSVFCCAGYRTAEADPLSDFSANIKDVVGSARSRITNAESVDDSTVVGDYRKILWSIRPRPSHQTVPLSPSAARWIVLSWISKLLNGETMNRKMLERLTVEASNGKNYIDAISSSVIKGFPGLHLAEDILSLETGDYVMAIDSIVESLTDHSSTNIITAAILSKPCSCCFAIYFNNRGHCKDVVLLEVNFATASKGMRGMAFASVEDLQEYLMEVPSLKSFSSVCYYIFTVKSPHHDESKVMQQPLPKMQVIKTTIPSRNNALESTDPRKDAKIVFSHAKLVAKM